MRLRTTITLAILTAGLAWFVARDEFARAPDAGSSRKLFAFQKKDVDTIEVSGKDQSVVLQRRGANWWITTPLEDRANPLPVEAILQILLRLENIETLEPGSFSKEQSKRLGLNGTAIQLVLSGGGKKLASCKIGTRTPLENSVYLTTSNSKGVELIHAAKLPFAELSKSAEPSAKKFDFLTMLETPAQAWRDPALIRLKADDVRAISFSAGTGLMKFRREAGRPWELARPLQTRASDERVNAVLATLLHMVARPSGKDPANSNPTDAALPGMKVSIDVEGMDAPVELSLQPGADPNADILATVTGRPGTFLLPSKAADVWKLQPNDLREPRLATIDANLVKAVRIRSQSHPEIVLDKQGDTWMLTRFGQTAPANADRVFQLFGDLNAAQIREFASDAATNLEPFGLHQPALELEWREGEKTTLLQFGVNAESRVFCRYDNEPFIYRVHPSLISAIPADGVKWQGLGILNLSTLVVRRVVITEGDTPSVSLHFDPQTNAWSGEIASKDVTAQIQKDKANALLNKLVSLSAETWVSDRTAGYEALKRPSLTVQILVIDPSRPGDPPAPRTLMFASTNPAQPAAPYYGRLDANPDLFLLSREQYREIVSPVVK